MGPADTPEQPTKVAPLSLASVPSGKQCSGRLCQLLWKRLGQNRREQADSWSGTRQLPPGTQTPAGKALLAPSSGTKSSLGLGVAAAPHGLAGASLRHLALSQ